MGSVFVYETIRASLLKLAHIIVNLAREENIQSTHLAEALQYRPKGMMV